MTRATEHLCDNHPDGKGWYPGDLTDCDYHTRIRPSSTKVRQGRVARAKADKAQGAIGTDRGGYIHGH